jgi:ribosomal protein S18 acetylase RimI-like enzyme
MTAADVPFADSLRAHAGWNQLPADWERFLATEPDGCFVAEWSGSPAGTATTIIYGAELAWIGMVLVHPDRRRRGIGQALLQRCIGHLRGRGVRCIKLDATPLGKPVYDGLGFQDEWTLTRWERSGPPDPSAASDPTTRIRDWRETDADRLERIDTAAFGVSRRRLLAELGKQSRGALVAESETGDPIGHGRLRQGARAFHLGPVVARSAETAIAIIEALLTRHVAGADGKIFWDIPDQNTAAVAWAGEHGFTIQRTLTRMYLGDNTAPGDPRMQFAISAPELG